MKATFPWMKNMLVCPAHWKSHFRALKFQNNGPFLIQSVTLVKSAGNFNFIENPEEVLSITNNFLYPSNSKIYEKKNSKITKLHYSEQFCQPLGPSLHRVSAVLCCFCYLYFRRCSITDMNHCCCKIVHSLLSFPQQHVNVLCEVTSWYCCRKRKSSQILLLFSFNVVQHDTT